MEQLTDGDESKIIQFSLNNARNVEAEAEVDLIDSLINEFTDFEEVEEYDVILDHSPKIEMSFKESPLEMATTIEKQVHSLKDQIKRLRYYLDEISID